MVDKSELVAFEREKRLYKDAYVENFRSVRYFPSLATIGTGQTNGGNIVLVQEPHPAAATVDGAAERSRFNDVANRLISPDSVCLSTVEASGFASTARFHDVLTPASFFWLQLDATLPLTMFRSAIMCKHTKARQERRAAETSSIPFRASAAPLGRHHAHSNTVRLHGISLYLPTLDSCMRNDRQPGVFKPTSVVEAKGAIQRKVTYDGQPFEDKPRTVRSVTPRADAKQTWAINNPTNARKEICGRAFFNMPPKGTIKADRKYTQEFIRLTMEAHLAGRRAANDSIKGDFQRDH